MKNKAADLNNHLFAQIERLSDESLSPEEIEKEVSRTTAIVKVSEQIISNADLSLKAAKLVAENGGDSRKMLTLFDNNNNQQAIPIIKEQPKVPDYRPASIRNAQNN
jgi:hypothetical protein